MRLFVWSLAAILLRLMPSAVAADELDSTFQRLREAQAKDDPAEVKKVALQLHELACGIIATAAPADADEKEAWAAGVQNAKNADLYTEYALYATGIKSQPATLVDLVSTLELQNPKSKYLDEAYGPYLLALSRTGSAAKVPRIAEKALGNFPENEDLLLVMVDSTRLQKQNDRALGYANRLIGALNKHTKPENLPVADWQRKRNLALAHGYWTAGVIYAEKGQYAAADKNLRAALPLVKGNDGMLGPALFHLGMANYHLGKMTMNKARVLEGASFSEQAAAIESPYADQARHNALVMKTEGQRMR